MSTTTIADLWTPSRWVQGMPEAVAKQSNLLTSPAVVTSPAFNEVASGGGLVGQMPFLQEPDFDDEIQVENTAPTVNALSSSSAPAPILNRVSAVGATALAGAVSASDPLGYAQGVAARLRLRQRERCLLSILRGAFGNADLGSGAALAALAEVHADEDAATPASDQLIDTEMIFDAVARLGEAKGRLEQGGILWIHSDLENALSKADQIEVIRNSAGEIVLRTWKNFRLFVNDGLRRAGTTSGYVYDTYIFAAGTVGMGDKPQVTYAGAPESVASIVFDTDAAANNRTVYDRTRFVLQPFGLAWGGSPAGQSATNAELATKASWSLAYADAANVGIVNLLTNG